MFDFKEITLEDMPIFESYTNTLPYLNDNLCFVDLLLWQQIYKTKYCIHNGSLLIRYYNESKNKYFYVSPLGGEFLSTVKDLISYDNSTMLTGVSEENLEILKKEYPDLVYREERDFENYIYKSEKLINLAGKKLHSKRNHINKFKLTYEGRWEYKDMTAEDIRLVFAFHLKWCELNDSNEDLDIIGETTAIATALRNFEALKLKGGYLLLDGEIIAFTIGSPCGSEMFMVHIEKADASINGAYQMINNCFARANFAPYNYINRQEDLGIEGLRKAKLSYYPDILEKVYTAFWGVN